MLMEFKWRTWDSYNGQLRIHDCRPVDTLAGYSKLVASVQQASDRSIQYSIYGPGLLNCVFHTKDLEEAKRFVEAQVVLLK